MATARSSVSTVRGTQPLHGFPSLGDGLRRLIDRALKGLLGIGRARSEQLANRLKAKQQSLKALQQCVVQITCDAGALGDALLQARVECPRDLTQPQSI